MVVWPNAIVAVVQQQQQFRAHPQWYVVTLNKKTGRQMGRFELRGEPLPEGLLVDSSGRVVVTMLDGSVTCLDRRG